MVAVMLLLDDCGGSSAPVIRVITGTRWYRKKEEGNPDQILQEFIGLNYERLEVRNEIRQQAGDFYDILRQTAFPDVGSDLALAAIVYIAALDQGSAYTFKEKPELKISETKDSTFFAMKIDIVEHLQVNGYPELRQEKIQSEQLVDRYCRQLNMPDADSICLMLIWIEYIRQYGILKIQTIRPSHSQSMLILWLQH